MDGDKIDLITKVKDAPQRSGSNAYLVIVTAAERDVIVRALREKSAREYGSEAVTTEEPPMSHMSELTHDERMKRLRELIARLKHEPLKGHEPYLLDLIEMLVDELE